MSSLADEEEDGAVNNNNNAPVRVLCHACSAIRTGRRVPGSEEIVCSTCGRSFVEVLDGDAEQEAARRFQTQNALAQILHETLRRQIFPNAQGEAAASLPRMHRHPGASSSYFGGREANEPPFMRGVCVCVWKEEKKPF